jgi:outer membrane receptor for ferrienterochelin and colicin
MRRVRFVLVLAMVLGVAAGVAGQGNPTGAIRGQVLDPDGLGMPGVTVTASSPALQGLRTAVTSENGDFMIPFLPPGEYTITFELEGFQQQKQTISVAMAETQPMQVKLALAALEESITVTGTASTEVLTTATVAATYRKDQLERLPVGRTLNDAVLLTPGVTPTGPSNNIIMAGSLSFETLYLVNGVVINENLRGQALNLFIEDAIQETKTSTASISAEYGRFQGGVVNMITKSGGNMFSGSFRTTFVNDAWRALTPYKGDSTADKVTPIYEGTAGGPILRDKIWFFGAGRYTKPEQNRTFAVTEGSFTTTTDERRYEGKVTYALNQRNNVKASYTRRTTEVANNWFGQIMDAASLYDNSTLQSLATVNYTSVLTNNLFLEGQWSKKIGATMDTGSQFTDLVKGTHISDRSRTIGTDNPRFNSPTFCAVCGDGWLEHRDNWDWFVKLNYFLSTKKTGSHNLSFGFDNFKEWRKNDNWQSGSEYTLSATRTIIDGSTIYPVFASDNTTYINYLPILQRSVGNDIKTYSGYVNDNWRLNDHFSFNLGARYDMNRSKDQSGTSVVKDSQWSPRVGMSYDLNGDGKWVANASFSRYVMGISTALVDAGSAGGRQASFSWFYQGPAINTGAGPYLTADQALPILWNWFFANGGTNRATRTAPNIPGVSTKVMDGVVSPSSNELSVGIANQFTPRSTWRVDYVYRKSIDMYGDFLDMTTGVVSDSTGRRYNLTQVGNTDQARRSYHGMISMVTHRVGDLQLGANYTLGRMWGNANGENVGSGPVRASMDSFPEYREESWNYPMGYNPGDQRHKLRAWFAYPLPLPEGLGRFDLGLVQRFDSGVSQDITGGVNPTAYVTNPGYISAPPSNVGYYFFERGSYRFDSVWCTDLSLMWGKKLPQLGNSELFFRGVLTNLFNNSAVVSGDIGINTRVNNSAYQAFNPFTQTPVQGVHWDYATTFGQPTSFTSYQPSRQFVFSVGYRF